MAEAQPKTEAPAKIIDKAIKLGPGRITPAEFAYTTHVATVEPGTTVEHMLDPSYWSNEAAKFRPTDIIQVRCDDGSFWAEFLVLACDRTWAKIHPLRFVKLTADDASLTLPSNFEIKHRGALKKWSVIRRNDGAIMREEMETRGEAEKFLTEYQRTIAKAA